jgi:hypothetical protein
LEKDLIFNGGKTIFFVSILKNKLDTKAKRGSIVKSLALGSTRPNIPECFKAVANCLLDKIFEAAEESKNYDDTVK